MPGRHLPNSLTVHLATLNSMLWQTDTMAAAPAPDRQAGVSVAPAVGAGACCCPTTAASRAFALKTLSGLCSAPGACRRPRGFGFVEFVDTRDAEDAMYALDGKNMGGRDISVSKNGGASMARQHSNLPATGCVFRHLAVTLCPCQLCLRGCAQHSASAGSKLTSHRQTAVRHRPCLS